MRIVRTRSIPNVETDRLLTDASRLHDMLHTHAGLHAFDGPRRQLIDNGVKIAPIRAELAKRGVSHPEPRCRICSPAV